MRKKTYDDGFIFSFKIRLEYRLPYTYMRELSKVNPTLKNYNLNWQKVFEFGCMTLQALLSKGYRITAPAYFETRPYNNTSTFTGTIIEEIKQFAYELDFKQPEVIEFCLWLYFMIHMSDEEITFFKINKLEFQIDPPHSK